MKDKRVFSILSSYLPAVALIAIIAVPDIFHIPHTWQPWIFLGAIAWVIITATGVLH